MLSPWNNGKSGAKLDLTSSTTPGLQIHMVDHTRTANPCDWLPCRRAVLLLVSCPHSLVYLHLVEGLIFCIPATPHLGTSFPLFHGFRTQKFLVRYYAHQTQVWKSYFTISNLRIIYGYSQFTFHSQKPSVGLQSLPGMSP